jgi:2-keto-4-pentenoate hydratase/2-oxohepta-3-ene-1,7-dioic acid hydratase in catechol pathway
MGFLLADSGDWMLKFHWSRSSCCPLCCRGKIVCIGRNYVDHAREQNVDIPEIPYLSETAFAIIGPGDTILLPPQSNRVEQEELG